MNSLHKPPETTGIGSESFSRTQKAVKPRGEGGTVKIKSKCTISSTQMRLNTPKRYCYCPSPLADHLLCAVPPGGQLINQSSIAEITFQL